MGKIVATDRSVTTLRALRASCLSGTTAAFCLVQTFGATALAQDTEQEQPRRQSLVEQSWQLDTSLFYTNNFRRLSEEQTRTLIGLAPVQDTNGNVLVDADGNPQLVSVSTTEDVPIETPDNYSLSTTLSGSALFKRPSFTGLISGSIRAGLFLNQDTIESRILDSAPGLPDTAEFSVPTFPAGTVDQTLDVQGQAFGFSDLDNVFVDPNMTAAGTFRVVDNLFYVDVGALALEQNLSTTGVAADQGVGQTGDEVIYGGVSVSPFLFRRFGDESTVEVRFRATEIQVLSEQFDIQSVTAVDGLTQSELDDLQIENDSRSLEALAEYTSGELLDRVTFQVGAFARTVTEDGSDLPTQPALEFKQASGSFDITYAINRSIELTGGVGYDDIQIDDVDIPTLSDTPGAIEQAAFDDATELALAQENQEEALSGLFWRVGVNYAPTRRSRIQASIGERFGGTSVDLSARYRPSQRVEFSLSALRQLDTGLQDFVSGAFQIQSEAFSALSELAESQRNSAQILLDRALSFQGGGFRTVQRGNFGLAAINRVSAGVQGSFRRTNLSAGVSYSENDGDETGTKLFSVDFAGDRQISRRLSATAQASFSKDNGTLEQTIFENGLITDEVVLTDFATEEQFYSLGLAYQVGKKLSLTSQVYHVVRESDDSAPGTRFDYEETAAGLGLRWMF